MKCIGIYVHLTGGTEVELVSSLFDLDSESNGLDCW